MSDWTDSRSQELLRAERRLAGPASAAKARVYARVMGSIAVPAPLAPPAQAAAVARSFTVIKGGLLALALLGAGTAGALFGSQRVGPSAPAPLRPENALVAPAPVPPPPRAAPSASPANAAIVQSAPAPTSGAAATARAKASAAQDEETLAAERLLLDRARRHLLDGEPDRALAATREHLARFGRGVLAEERDALRIEALVALHRDGEARSSAARFRLAHPNSLFSSAVDDAISAAP